MTSPFCTVWPASTATWVTAAGMGARSDPSATTSAGSMNRGTGTNENDPSGPSTSTAVALIVTSYLERNPAVVSRVTLRVPASSNECTSTIYAPRRFTYETASSSSRPSSVNVRTPRNRPKGIPSSQVIASADRALTFSEKARFGATVENAGYAGNQGDFTVELERLDLPAFGSFAKSYGANLESGQFSTKTKVRLRGKTVYELNESRPAR